MHSLDVPPMIRLHKRAPFRCPAPFTKHGYLQNPVIMSTKISVTDCWMFTWFVDLLNVSQHRSHTLVVYRSLSLIAKQPKGSVQRAYTSPMQVCIANSHGHQKNSHPQSKQGLRLQKHKKMTVNGTPWIKDVNSNGAGRGMVGTGVWILMTLRNWFSKAFVNIDVQIRSIKGMKRQVIKIFLSQKAAIRSGNDYQTILSRLILQRSVLL